jgi:hypothetical protein
LKNEIHEIEVGKLGKIEGMAIEVKNGNGIE